MRSPLYRLALAIVGFLSLCVYSAYPAGLPQAPSSFIAEGESVGAGWAPPANFVIIPGPLRGFLRMAGISQKARPEDVLPLLARNAYLRGYENGQETEFLVLVDRYVHQARELQALTGTTGTIHVANCNDSATLIKILGYQLRQSCGQKNLTLATANAERAFLTIDSGFPLTQLEEALAKDSAFDYPYPSSQVPVLFNEKDWIGASVWKERGRGNLIDVILHDRSVARLYWALSRSDAQTSLALQRSPGLRRLLPYAAVLDFYGDQITIQSGKVIVPGGTAAEPYWKELVGASPESPGDFVLRLASKDNGWLAVYFDALSRISRTQQEHFVTGSRLKQLYEAYRTVDPGSDATKGVFAKGAELVILLDRVHWDSAGEPMVPGSLQVWKEIVNQKSAFKITRDVGKQAYNWNSPEQLLEAMVTFSRIETDSGPLQIYLTLSEIDSKRAPGMRLSEGTVRLLANKYSQFYSWYLTFSEFPELNDTSITRFIDVAESIDKISTPALRGNVLGSFQANIGLWQILARQGEIPNAKMNPSWQGMIDPFAKITSSAQLLDSARSSLGEILVATGGPPNRSQDEMIDLLAGPPQESADGRRMHREIAEKIHAVMDDQHLASLDTLFALGDGLNAMSHGAASGQNLLPLAAELREFELPRPIFTESEKIEWAPPVYSSRHAELQVKTDLAKMIKSPGSPAQLQLARGQLAPFLRDTLVGLNYAYYEPPGAQVLHNNPLFVRSHDFSGITIISSEPFYWHSPELFGVGAPAGGGAYLIGSLADLPYALAEMEEDFIVPENVQALIWKETVPDLMVSAVVPRWWNISSHELHAVALYQASGEELLTAAVKSPALRDKVITVLSDRLGPQRLEWVEESLTRPEDAAAMLPRMMPADTFYLGVEFHRKFPDEAASAGPASEQLAELCRRYPSETGMERLSRDFGTPHPTLAQTYSSEFLNVKQLPAFGGYSSRLFAESWESSNLYWARLADEMGYSPVMLNSLAPELTRRMTAKIFATDLEDWPALLRAMHEAGDDFRHGKVTTSPVAKIDSEH